MRVLTILIGVVALSGGCAKGSKPAPVERIQSKPGVKSDAKPKESPRASGTSTIEGVVRFEGKKPERKPVDGIAGNPFCKNCWPDALPLEDRWLFGKNGGDETLQNVLVYVSGGLEGKTFEPPKEPTVIDQVGCLYTPHVVSVMAGQKFEIRNSDATLHNVMTEPRPQKNRPFNIGTIKGARLKRVFKEPEFKIGLKCFLHPWMRAWVHVLPHPFHAVTREDGTFSLKGLPAGEYEISVMHESDRLQAKQLTIKVKVGEGETRKIEFVYSSKR